MVINVQDDILRLHAMGLLDRLLQDKATKGNILWATDAYSQYGEFYSPGNEIRSNRITGECSDLIKTRARRAMEQRTERTRQHAEVFTPLWIVKKMNDFVDEQWFDRKTGLYKLTKDGKICFGKKKHWKRYVDARRMEITCGEAPFLATRYDVETGEAIPITDRIGLLDRKLRVVTENALEPEEWKTWALRAVQSIYGYELQGDNLLIARVNILFTVEEHMFHRWKQKPEKPWLEKLCNVIAWNFWQMDGIRGCVPVPPAPTEEQLSLFPPIDEQTNLFGEMEIKDLPCRLFDWRGDHSISYSALRKKGSELMKFDFIIGNPPYQDETLGDNKGFAPPIYHKFMDASYSVADKVELIHPARFLFNAGSTPKEWNTKMLEDKHFKVLHFEHDASNMFSGTEIKGGVVISYRDAKKDFGAINVFSPYMEVNSIMHEVINSAGFLPLSNSMENQMKFDLDALYAEYPEFKAIIGSGGRDKRFRNNIFDKISLFTSSPVLDDDIAVIGVVNNKRQWRYFAKRFVDKTHSNLACWKVLVARVNGSGALGEVLSTPIVVPPNTGYTQTFIGIGAFASEQEANNALKYVKTKFLRTLLSVLKITQDNSIETWKMIPLQSFSVESDIDWSKSIPEIDRQLYRKYGLDDAEVEFIESHVKEMS